MKDMKSMKDVFNHLTQKWLLTGLLAALSLGIYINAYNHDFVVDDLPRIVECGYIKELSNFGMLINPQYTVCFKEQYRPLSTLGLMLNYTYSKLSPRGWFITNGVLHAAVTVLLFFFISALFSNTMVGLLTSFLFAIHPIHTEALNIAVYRTEIFAGFFFIASFFAFFEYAKDKKSHWYWISLLLFLVGLGFKESIASLPFVLLIYIWLFQKPEQKKHFWMGTIPFFGTIIGWLAFTNFYFIPLGGGPLCGQGNYTIPFWGLVHWRTIVYVVGRVFPRYLCLALLPTQMIFFFPQTGFGATPSVREIFGLIFIISLIIIPVLNRKKLGIPAFCLLFFFTVLLPVSYIFPMNMVYAERWLYIPSMGICLLLGYCFWLLLKNRQTRIGSVIVLLCLSGFYAAKTNQRNKQWHNSEIVWRENVRLFPEAMSARFYLADAIMGNNGAPEEVLEQIRIAHRDYSTMPGPYWRLCKFRVWLGQYGQAISGLEELRKAYPQVTENNAPFLCLYAKALILHGSPEKAIPILEKAVEIDRFKRSPYNALGNACVKAKVYKAAIAAYQQAIKIDRTWIVPYENLLILYEEILDDGKKAEEIREERNRWALNCYKSKKISGLWWGE